MQGRHLKRHDDRRMRLPSRSSSLIRSTTQRFGMVPSCDVWRWAPLRHFLSPYQVVLPSPPYAPRVEDPATPEPCCGV